MTSKLRSLVDALLFCLLLCIELELLLEASFKVGTIICTLANADCCGSERWDSCSADTAAALNVGNDFSWSLSNSWKNSDNSEESVCLSVCLYCYMYRILYIWLVIINKYTEDSFHIIINSGLITSCLMKLYAIEKRKNTMRRCPHSSIFTSNPCICDGTEEVGQLRSLTS